MGGDRGHIMNLGHGIEATTPEAKANFFVKTVQGYKH
jgi:uroporphyrinogen decarboxylase